MNNPSSLIPQGSVLEQKNKGRARVKIAVFFVLAVHGIGLLALLVQGCQNDRNKTAQAENTNAPAPPQFDATNPAVVAGPSTPAPTETNTTPMAEAGSTASTATEYTITSGDNYTGIAKKFHVTVKAIADANPGVEPTRLRLGQKIHIPAASAAAPSAPGALVASSTGSAEGLYTVKSGDTLSTIARQHSTTVRALRAANSLSTDRITVGQKLKLPKGSGAAPMTTASNDLSPASPAAAPSVPQTH